MPENKTTKPMSHVLVVSADPGWRDEVVAGINSAAQKLDNPFDLLAVPGRRRRRRRRRRARRRRHPDRADRPWRPRARGQGRQGRRAPPGRRRDGAGDHRAAARAVAVRDAGGRREQAAAGADWPATSVHGYFYRGEHDYNGWARILAAEIAEKSATPFYDELKNYVRMAKDSWHTPGHAGGDSLQGQPVGGRLLRLRGREPAARRPVGVGGDARLAAAPDRRDRAGPAPGRAGLRRAQDLLRHQRHVDRQQGDLPDAAGAGRQDAARSQLPQVGPPRRDPVGRAARSTSTRRSTASTACSARCRAPRCWPPSSSIRMRAC